VEDRLLDVATYTNDERWSARIRRGLQFETISLHVGHFWDARFVIKVDDEVDLLTDPRIPRLARDALEYRNTERVLIIEAGDENPTRLRVERDGRVGIIKGGEVTVLTKDLGWAALQQLDAASRPFADLAGGSSGQAA
jgi:hypothetical protein